MFKNIDCWFIYQGHVSEKLFLNIQPHDPCGHLHLALMILFVRPPAPSGHLPVHTRRFLEAETVSSTLGSDTLGSTGSHVRHPPSSRKSLSSIGIWFVAVPPLANPVYKWKHRQNHHMQYFQRLLVHPRPDSSTIMRQLAHQVENPTMHPTVVEQHRRQQLYLVAQWKLSLSVKNKYSFLFNAYF